MILLWDKHTNEEVLLLGAGSNNLSRAGWWDNIECQHWEEIKNREVSRKIINFLKDDVDFLNQINPEKCHSNRNILLNFSTKT